MPAGTVSLDQEPKRRKVPSRFAVLGRHFKTPLPQHRQGAGADGFDPGRGRQRLPQSRQRVEPGRDRTAAILLSRRMDAGPVGSGVTDRSRREPQVGEPNVDAPPRGVRVRVLEGVKRVGAWLHA